MKKLGILLLGMQITFSAVIAQSALQPSIQLPSNLTDQNNFRLKKKKQNNKVVGDTLWSDDFGSGILSCWATVTNNPGGASWQWSTTYDKGPFTQNIGAIQSSSMGNGFMMLPMDSIAGNRFPAPLTNAQFEGCVAVITPKPAVELQLQQFYRLCCAGGNILMQVEISTDNFQTFDSYDLFTMRPAFSNPVPNPEFVNINVSKTLSNADTAYIRFLMNGASHYFWMIDDLALVEKDPQDIDAVKMQLSNSYEFKSFPTISPISFANELQYIGEIENSTNDTLINAQLKVDVVELLNSTVAYSDSVQTSNSGQILPLMLDTTILDSPPFYPIQVGNYRADFTTNSMQYVADDTMSIFYEKSINIYARDYNSPTAKIGPSNYFVGGAFGGTVDGDKVGLLLTIDTSRNTSLVTNMPTSLTYYISADSANIGSVIRPVIWEFDTNSTINNVIIGNEVASSNGTYTITANQLNSWQTFNLDTGLAITNGLSAGQYLIGWEMVGGTSTGSDFTVWHDSLASTISFPYASFMQFAHLSSSNWTSIGAGLIPMIRMNLMVAGLGIKENNLENNFSIQPNPSNGKIQLRLEETLSNNAELKVYDINGKEVFQKQLNDGSQLIDLDLRELNTGVYILSLDDGVIKSQKKFIIKE